MPNNNNHNNPNRQRPANSRQPRQNHTETQEEKKRIRNALRRKFGEERKYGQILQSAQQRSNNRPDMLSPVKRLASIILVDASQSMFEHRATIKKSIRRLHEEIAKDSEAAHAVELGIYTFNDQIEKLQEITEVSRQNIDWPKLWINFAEPTMTGEAITIALSELMSRRETDRSSGLHTYPPILFILSDGKPQFPNDVELSRATQAHTQEQIQVIRRLVRDHNLVVVCLQIGRDPTLTRIMKDLTGLAMTDPLMEERYFCIDQDPVAIEKFFKWASDFLKSSSSATESGR